MSFGPSWLLTAVLAAGCAGPKPESGPFVMKPPAVPEPTPEQRDRIYRESFEEGLDLVRRENYGLALGAFEHALAMRPDEVDALFNLGACHEAIGDPFRAINIYRRVLELQPDDSDCYANLGTCFIKMYHRERTDAWREMAREAWIKSLELRPDQPAVRRYLELATSRG